MNLRYLKGAFALLVVLAACGESTDGKTGDPVPVCEEGNTICERSCVDTLIDIRNCGACGNACDAGEICSAGQCATSCPEGQTECSGACHDLDTSSANCGACGTVCEADQFCSAGVCGTQCPDGQSECDGGCHDLQASPAHCGACGTTCAAGESCSDGACVTACPAGQEACDGGCYNLATERQHCGACGTTCQDGEACIDGACGVVCDAGELACDGICRDVSSDRNNCGACGTACGDGELCVDGSCDLHCATGLTECDGTCRDTGNDRNNCGACGVACGEGELCVAGACALTCGDFASEICNGACTNTAIDPANCGACGNACAAGEMCSNGACATDCGTTLAVCGSGCTDVLHDPANCGTCDAACPVVPGAAAVCADGDCANSCYFGQADCDRDLGTSNSNGCETETFTNANNCGGCGVVCPAPANATASCMSGSCGLGSCNADFNNCDFDPANGCESNSKTDENNCGFCGVQCPAGTMCVDSACIVPAGEDCSSPYLVLAGANTINYVASRQDYLVTPPSCSPSTSYLPVGGDVVLQYDALFDGDVTLSLGKENSQRAHMVVGTGTCGLVTPELLCVSEFSGTTMGGTFPVRAGESYYIYISDSTSGSNPLLPVLDLQITEAPCTIPVAAPVVTGVTPATGSTAAKVRPEIQVVFDTPVYAFEGTVTVTGNLGTSHTLALPSPDVIFSTDGRTMSILTGAAFLSGETITVGLAGLEAAGCGGAAAAPYTWSFSLPVIPCTPGAGGMVGATTTRVPSGLVGTAPTEYYVAADSDPNGYVYFGGTTALYRAPKAGGMPQDVKQAAGLVDANLGYAVLIDGTNIYTADSKTTGTDGHLFRISTDGGASWNVQNAATFPSVPTDDIHSLAAHGGRIYMITHESSSTVNTQIWSIDSAAVPAPPGASDAPGAPALLDLSFAGYTYCSGLAVDGLYFYTACRVGTTSTYAVLRIERATGTITHLTEDFPGNTTQMALQVKDATGDGIADYVYYNEDVEEGYAICTPHGTPYADILYSFGTGTSNYGLGFDPVANVLWGWDDDTMDFIQIH